VGHFPHHSADEIGQSVGITVQECNSVAMFGCCGKLRPRNTWRGRDWRR
jgi:hypothetical protein